MTDLETPPTFDVTRLWIMFQRLLYDIAEKNTGGNALRFPRTLSESVLQKNAALTSARDNFFMNTHTGYHLFFTSRIHSLGNL